MQPKRKIGSQNNSRSVIKRKNHPVRNPSIFNVKKHFKKVIIALDRDATTKAFDISNQLRYYMDTEVKILEDDLKYFDKPQIESLLQ